MSVDYQTVVETTPTVQDALPLVVHCADCGDSLDSDDAVHVEDKPMCESCADCYVVLGDGDTVHIDDAVFLEYEEQWVRADEAFCCDSCQGTFHLDDRHRTASYNYDEVCTCCREEYFAYPADDEDNLYHTEDLHWCDRSEQWYCDEDNIRGDRYLHCYSTDVLDEIEHKCILDDGSVSYTFASKLIFGVELETGTRDGYLADDVAQGLCEETNFPDYGICKEDGSVSGPELVSLPATLLAHKNVLNWDKWTTHLRESCRGYYSNAGMHVHINKEAISQLTLGKMLVFTNARENADLLSGIAQRNILETSWCETNYQKFDKVAKSAKEPRNGKYSILNVTNKTVECRMFRSTLMAERVYKNLEFCHALVQFCIDTSARQLTARMFVQYVASHSAQYPNLHQFIIDRELTQCV